VGKCEGGEGGEGGKVWRWESMKVEIRILACRMTLFTYSYT
jgi:GTPase involved in cell partitioning and DNA repair